MSFIAAFDDGGQYQWARLFGDSGETTAYSVAFDPASGLHVAGWFDGTLTVRTTIAGADSIDAFVAIFTRDGQPVRATRIGGPGCDRVDAIALTGGALAVAGRFSGTLGFGASTLVSAGDLDGMLLTLGVDGTPGRAWQRGGPLDDRLTAIATTPTGVLIGGTVDQPIGGGPCGSFLIFDVRDMLLEALVTR